MCTICLQVGMYFFTRWITTLAELVCVNLPLVKNYNALI
jgi:hypothetical protein